MTQAFRVAGGASLDRARPVSFTFDGVAYGGYEGDTLASALLANGVRLVGRSYKYHRPRGIFRPERKSRTRSSAFGAALAASRRTCARPGSNSTTALWR